MYRPILLLSSLKKKRKKNTTGNQGQKMKSLEEGKKKFRKESFMTWRKYISLLNVTLKNKENKKTKGEIRGREKMKTAGKESFMTRRKFI